MTQNGDLVLSGAAGSDGQPIKIPVSAKKVTVNADGTLSADGAVVAKLQVDDFPDVQKLTPEGASTFAAPAGSGITAPSTVVMQGALEGSNADAVVAAAQMMDLQRVAQALEKAISIFHNEFNKTAAQDLGRV